jgi:hypothetical protein
MMNSKLVANEILGVLATAAQGHVRAPLLTAREILHLLPSKTHLVAACTTARYGEETWQAATNVVTQTIINVLRAQVDVDVMIPKEAVPATTCTTGRAIGQVVIGYRLARARAHAKTGRAVPA